MMNEFPYVKLKAQTVSTIKCEISPVDSWKKQIQTLLNAQSFDPTSLLHHYNAAHNENKSLDR